jgi:hypothetical protein
MNKQQLTERKKHKIGKHGAVGMLVNRNGKLIRICVECDKPINEKK